MNNILIFIILFLKIKLIYSKIGEGYNIKAININNEIDVVIFQTQEFYLNPSGITIPLTFNATNIIKTSNNEFIIIGCDFLNTSDNNIYYKIFNYTDKIYTDDKVQKITINQFNKNNIYIINIYNSTDLIIIYFINSVYKNKIFNYKNNEDITINYASDEPLFNRDCKKNILCENIIDITIFCICEGENTGTIEEYSSIYLSTTPFYGFYGGLDINKLSINGKSYQMTKIDNFNYIICYLNDAKLFCSYIELIEYNKHYIPIEKYKKEMYTFSGIDFNTQNKYFSFKIFNNTIYIVHNNAGSPTVGSNILMATYNFDIFHETYVKGNTADDLSLDYDIIIYENKIDIYYEKKEFSLHSVCSINKSCVIDYFSFNTPYMVNTFNNSFTFKITENISQTFSLENYTFNTHLLNPSFFFFQLKL